MLQVNTILGITELLKSINTKEPKNLQDFEANLKDISFQKNIREKFGIPSIELTQEDKFDLIRSFGHFYYDSAEAHYRNFLIESFKDSITKLPNCTADKLLHALSYDRNQKYDEFYKFLYDKFWKK